ncbi:hypothetical protein F5B18DRAFT_287405 [Nemania serpens]|nr:hypothetical protein F5B18DRAFT_287405 [Nemania serpens]
MGAQRRRTPVRAGKGTCYFQVARSRGTLPITPNYNKSVFEGGTCPELGPFPTKRDFNYLTTDGNYSHSHSHTTHNSHGLAKRTAVLGPVLSVPVGNCFCPPESDDSAGPGTVCSKIGYA